MEEEEEEACIHWYYPSLKKTKTTNREHNEYSVTQNRKNANNISHDWKVEAD